MLSDRNGLKAFFLELAGARADVVAQEIALLEPLCSKADRCFFDLADARDVEKQDVLKAVSVATGDAPVEVRFASLADGAHDHDFYWSKITDDLGVELRTLLCARYAPVLTAEIGVATYDQMLNVFWATLGEPLWHAFEHNRWDDLGQRLCHTVRASVLATAVHELGFVAVGDEAHAAHLRPLLQLYSKTAVLGRRKSAPDTVVTIVA